MNSFRSLKPKRSFSPVSKLLKASFWRPPTPHFSSRGPVDSRTRNFWLALLGAAILTLPRLAAQTAPLDLPTNPSFAGTSVLAIAVQNDGKILVGGSFTSVDSMAPANLARLNENGSLDTSWTGTVDGIVRAICVVGTDVFIGGSFTTVNGEPRNRLAKLSLENGALDAAWNPGLTGTGTVVNAITHAGGYLYVGGTFTSFAGGSRSNLARFSTADGSLDSWNRGANSTVNALTFDGDYVYAGGNFTAIATATPSASRNRLVRFLASTGAADVWNPIPTGTFVVHALAAGGGHVYVGGTFTSPRTRLARFAVPSGILDASWTPSATSTVNAIAVSSEHIYVGGAFTTALSDTHNRLKRYLLSGTLDSGWIPGPTNTVNALTLSSTRLYVGGSFINIGGQSRNRFAAFSTGTPPVINTQPATQMVNAGSPVTFSVAAIGSPTLFYQWRKNGEELAGENAATLSIAAAQSSDAGAYSVVVTNDFGNVTSADAVLTVLITQPPSITTHPAPQTVTAGQTAAFTVVATGLPAPTLQWYRNDVLIDGATTSTLSIPNAQASNAGSYHVVATNAYGTATSNSASLTVNFPPTITSQPNGASVVSGGSVDLSVVANGTGTLNYQWYRASSGTEINPVGSNSANFNTGAIFTAAQFWVKVINTFGSANSTTAMVALGSGPTITSHPTSQTVAAGANVNFTGAASGATSYQWLKNGNSIPGATGTTLSLTNVTAGSAGNYTLAASNPYGSAVSDVATLTVLSPPVITTQPSAQATIVGGSASFSVAAAGSGLTYQWSRNFSELPGQTASTLTLTNIQPSDTGDYRVVVTNNLGSVTSNLAVLTVNVPPGITTQPQSGNVATGQTRALSVTASGSPPFNYTWYRGASGDVSDPVGGNASTFSTPSLTATTSFWVRVWNSYGTVNSVTATLTVGDPPTVATAPEPQTVLAGFSAVFSVTAGGTPPFTYQWKKDGNFLGAATDASYAVNNTGSSNAGTYTVTIGNAFGSITSVGVLLTVNSPPAISSHPQPLLRNVGAEAVFNVTATGTAPLAYQWKKDGIVLPGQAATTLTLPSVGLGDVATYTVTVTNAYGSVTSNAAGLEVNSPPVLTASPASLSLASGLTATLSVSVLGSAPFTYQWYRGEAGDISQPVGPNAPIFTTSALTASTAYWLRITNPFGSVETPTVFITVGLPPVITTDPATQVVLGGADVSFTVVTSGTAPFTYQWFKGVDPLVNGTVNNATTSGVTTATLNLQNVNAATAGAFSVRVTNAFGSVDSAAASLTVNFPPAITQPPQPQIVAAGGTANFTVTATGTGPLSYQWQKDGTDLPSATNPALAVPNAQLTNEGAYRVVITSPFGTATSAAVALTVNTPPSLVQQPASRTIFAGETATLTVAATGSGPLVYQWYQGAENDTSLPVGIDSSIFVTPVLTATRQYWVRVSNAFGVVQSATITVTVQPAIPVITSNSTFTAPVGQLFRYRITATHIPTAFTAEPLPDGLALDPATGWISGLPTTAGVSSVALTAANAQHTGNATLSLTLTPAVPVITSAPTARGRAGELFSYQITATNAPSNYGAVGLPNGLEFSATTGLISGPPQAAGTFALQLRATNAGGLGLATLALTIDPGTVPPVITSAAFASGKVSVPFAFQMRATQSPTGFAAIGLPDGLNIHPTTGLITGTPLEAGDFPVAATASNAGGSGPVQTWLLRINPPAGVPVITSAATASGPRGGAFSFQITATNSPTLYSVSPALPANLTLNTATGLISGTPTASGTFTVQLTAANVLGSSAPRPLILTIGPNVLAPVLANTASARGYVGIPFTLNLSASPAATQFQAANLPPGLTLNPTTGQISGTPLEAGTWAATLTGENAAGLGPDLVVTFTIAPAPPAPVVTPGLVFQGNVGTPMQAQLLATQLPATFTSTALPAGLSLAPESGLIAGTPLVAGEFPVTVTAENIAGRSAATEVIFQIAPPIGSPDIVSSLIAEGALDQPFSYRISTTPVATVFSAEPLPAGLSRVGDLLSGTPLIAGTFDVTLTAANAAGQGRPCVLKLVIRAGSATPRLTSSPAASATVGAVFTYQATAINGPITAYRADNLPAGLSLDPQTGLLTGTPSAPGIFTIPLSAANENGPGDPLNLVLTIAPAAQTPVVFSATRVQGYVSQELFYRAEATNLPTQRPLPSGTSFYAENLPPGLTITNTTGEIVGTPTQGGNFFAQIWAKNVTGPGTKTTVEFAIRTYTSTIKVLSPGHLLGNVGQPLVFNLITSTVADSYYLTRTAPEFFANNGTRTGNQITLTPVLAGRTGIRVSAYQGSNGDYIDTVVDILPSAAQPVLTSPTLAYGTVGQPFTYTATATNNPTAFGVRNTLPVGLALAPVTGVISGAPTTPGTFTIVLEATNASGTGAPREVVVVIQPAPAAPVITGSGSLAVGPNLGGLTTSPTSPATGVLAGAPSSLTLATKDGRLPVNSTSLSRAGQVGVPFSLTLTASGGPDRFEASGLPDGLALNEATGVIAGTPALAGTFELRVSAVNAAGPGAAVVLTLTIAPAAGTPIITGPLAASGQVGQPFTYTLTATPAPLGFTAADLPTPLALDSTTGIISGTPAEPGVFTIPLSASNALGTGSTKNLTLTVLAAANTPVITSAANAPGNAGASFHFQLTASNSPTAFNLSDLPVGLSFDPANGTITGTPLAPGTLTVQVGAENEVGKGGSIPFTFSISPAATSPALTSATLFEVAAGVPFTFQLTASNSPASFNHSALPGGLSLHPVTGLLAGTLATPGDYPLTLSANNASGPGPSLILTLRAFAQTSFRGWAIAQNLPVGSSGPLDAPFGDGVKNLHRFAFALPAPGAVAGLPRSTIITGPGGSRYLALVFTRARNLTGVTFKLRGSNTLGGWQDVNTIVEVLETIDSTTERVRLRDSQAVTEGTERFLQLGVTTAP